MPLPSVRALAPSDQPTRQSRRPLCRWVLVRTPNTPRTICSGVFFYQDPVQKKEAIIRQKPRVNQQIRLSPVRVVNHEGQMLGEMPTPQALELATEAGLDLVEVSPDARPPVCRIMDHGKAQYEQQKRRSGGAKQHRQQLKQVRMRAKIGQHDIDFKLKKVRTFLRKKDKVKINVLFRGRENAHHEIGRNMLNDMADTLQDVAEVERPPSMESRRQMSLMLKPKSSAQ